MQRTLKIALALVLAGPGLCRGQVSGNIAYSGSGGKAGAEQRERNRRVLTEHELPPTGTSMFIEANVLMNVKADEYVAVLGVAREAETVAECGEQMDATIREFSAALEALGIDRKDVFIDFVAQNRIYGFELADDIAREKLVGFELKKNVSIRYSDPDLLDRLLVAAARSEIFDLIKVDSIVRDIEPIHDRLMEEAARVIKRKTTRYRDLLGITLRPPAQVYAERTGVHYPAELYDSYTAAESEQVGSPALRQKYTIQTARKSQTFFHNGLDADGFDTVVNPVLIEPVVQFTLHLKVRYEIEQGSQMDKPGDPSISSPSP